MNRRNFLKLTVGVPASWAPLCAGSARAQSIAKIGFLHSSAPSAFKSAVEAFRRGLNEFGYLEGANAHITYLWAEDRYDRLPGMASELVAANVNAIAVAGGPVPARAARQATAIIPIVFTLVADPVRSGLVKSLNRPEGNVTGNAGLTVELDAKRLELLNQLFPSAVVAAFVNSNRPDVEAQIREIEVAAKSAYIQLEVYRLATETDIHSAFQLLASTSRRQSVLVGADPFLASKRDLLVALARRYSIPAIYQWREFAVVGGLMAYGPRLEDSYRLTGQYVGRILKGEKPSDLPVQQPTRFELVINLKTAEALGLDVPPTLAARADEVIE